MSALTTFAEQIKEFGTFIEEHHFDDGILTYYRMDDSTVAVISSTEAGKIQGAKFFLNTGL